MTREEIETYAARLRDTVAKVKVPTDCPPDVRRDMVKLAMEVGACPLHQYSTVDDLFLVALADRIHQVLQTASMIDACRTAATNQRTAVIAAIIAGIAAAAAWGAVIVEAC